MANFKPVLVADGGQIYCPKCTARDMRRSTRLARKTVRKDGQTYPPGVSDVCLQLTDGNPANQMALTRDLAHVKHLLGVIASSASHAMGSQRSLRRWKRLLDADV